MQIKQLFQIGILISLFMLLGACPMAKGRDAQTVSNSSINFFKIFDSFGKTTSLWKALPENYHLKYNPNRKSIAKEIRWFQKQQDYINELTRNARPYIYYIYQETKKRHLPAELALIPMIESNYKPFKYSHSGAIGLWQMMPGTASGLGLTINWWYDGRRSIIDSTNAALAYLTYLHDYFGNWLLAIAAYDSGEGTVQNAILYNKRHGKPTDFWALSLPKETKSYVPKLLALASIIKNPKFYHLTLKPVRNKVYFKTVTVDKQMDLYRIAKYSELPLKTIRALNPGFRRWATLPNQAYHILLPVDKINLFMQHVYGSKLKGVTWFHHEIQSGDTLSMLAHRYHTNIKILKKVNSLSSDHLRIGRVLLIPYAYKGEHFPKSHRQSVNIAEDRIPGPKQIVHSVKRNESLWRIAAKYGVTPSNLRYWNNLPYRTQLHQGQKLIIWKKSHHHRFAARHFYRYRVKKGDSLSVIAKRFSVSLENIKRINQLSSDLIRIGMRLKIPTSVAS